MHPSKMATELLYVMEVTHVCAGMLTFADLCSPRHKMLQSMGVPDELYLWSRATNRSAMGIEVGNFSGVPRQSRPKFASGDRFQLLTSIDD